MKNWQKNRNYREYKNPDGSLRFVVTVGGTDVKVNEAVYKAYSQADRRERYSEESEKGLLLSFNGMANTDELLSYLADHCTESAEDVLIRVEDMAIRDIHAKKAAAAFMALEPDERNLIQALVIDGVTEGDYAEKIGLTQQGVNKRKKRILERLKKAVVKP